jgi:hypothetical protein
MQIKKIILTLVIAVSLTSCKKTYTCNCVTTFDYSGSPSSTFASTPDVAYTNKMTKKKATAACQHEGKNINNTYTNILTNNGQGSVPGGTSVSTDCSLK